MSFVFVNLQEGFYTKIIILSIKILTKKLIFILVKLILFM
nr:MAG TPA: hypothetical protein [Bacteriophage sp.]